jgi:hypothetical protein
VPSIEVVPPVKVVLTPVEVQTFDVTVSAPNPVVQVVSEGPQGPSGPQGEQGEQGVQGEQGIQGEQGRDFQGVFRVCRVRRVTRATRVRRVRQGSCRPTCRSLTTRDADGGVGRVAAGHRRTRGR